MRSFIFCLATALTMSGLAAQTTQTATRNESRAQQIAQDLKQSGKLKGYRVGVKFEDGVAWLTGTVTSQQQKHAAEQIARRSAGVEQVVSRLEVENRAPEVEERDFDQYFEVASNVQVRPQQREMAARQRAQRTVRRRPAQSRNQGANNRRRPARSNMPVPYARTGGGPAIQPAAYSRQAQHCPDGNCMPGGRGGPAGGMGPASMGRGGPSAMGQSTSYDNPQMPGYAWPSYAASPNYAALTYPKQYSPSAWPYIGPFYPYPQVPLGWRKVTLEWDDGWWFLDFKDK